MIIYAYYKVAQKKQSYIEVFFEISGGLIKNLLDKCEDFNKKLQKEDDDFNDSIILYDEKYNEDTLIINENIKENNNNIYKYQRGNNKLQSSRIFKIK